MVFGVTEILIGISVIFFILYSQLTSNFDFWKKRNVKGPKPIPLFGNLKDAVFGKIHFALLFQQFYDEYKSEPFFGVFLRSKPTLVIRDPDLIKDVLIKDFSVFPDRGIPGGSKDDPFSQNLLSLEHERWRPLRNKLSPVFSSGRLKDMFYLILNCADIFETYVEKLAAKGEPIECRELTAKYTTDAIGVCAFGLNTNSLGDEDGQFRKAGRELMDNSWKNILRRMVREWMPAVYNLMRPLVYNGAIDFFVNSIKDTVKHRKENQIRRNDFVDLLMDLRDQPDKLTNFEFTESLMISQAFIFFLAGFETSSTTISNAMYELALHPEVQDKLRKEIQETLKNDGKFTYENIKSMKYLGKVVKETLRKYPPGSILQRKSVSEYTFTGTKLTVPKNTRVVVPVWAIHHDPEIFSDPEAFDPERFSEENESSRHPMNYLPFGDGPHNCIGLRFANYQTKIGIAVIVNKFKLDVCDKTCIPYKVHPRGLIPSPIGGIQLKITKL